MSLLLPLRGASASTALTSDGDDGAWAAGMRHGQTFVQAAAGVALAAQMVLAGQVATQPQDEVPWVAAQGPSGGTGYVVQLNAGWKLPWVARDTDDIVPQPVPLGVDEDYWQNPVPPEKWPDAKPAFSDTDELRWAVQDGNEWVAPPPVQWFPPRQAFTDTDVLSWWLDEEGVWVAPPPVAFWPVPIAARTDTEDVAWWRDEGEWQVALPPRWPDPKPAVSDTDEIVPQPATLAADEDYWNVVRPPLWPDAKPAVQTDDEWPTPSVALTVEDEPAPVARAKAEEWWIPAPWAFGGEDSASTPRGFDEDYWQNAVPPVPLTFVRYDQWRTETSEIATPVLAHGSGGSRYVVFLGAGWQSPPAIFGGEDELPQGIPLNVEEEYWQNPVRPAPWPDAKAPRWGDEAEMPPQPAPTPLGVDEDYWTNSVRPIGQTFVRFDQWTQQDDTRALTDAAGGSTASLPLFIDAGWGRPPSLRRPDQWLQDEGPFASHPPTDEDYWQNAVPPVWGTNHTQVSWAWGAESDELPGLVQPVVVGPDSGGGDLRRKPKLRTYILPPARIFGMSRTEMERAKLRPTTVRRPAALVPVVPALPPAPAIAWDGDTTGLLRPVGAAPLPPLSAAKASVLLQILEQLDGRLSLDEARQRDAQRQAEDAQIAAQADDARAQAMARQRAEDDEVALLLLIHEINGEDDARD